jgi:hypothetical protein
VREAFLPWRSAAGQCVGWLLLIAGAQWVAMNLVSQVEGDPDLGRKAVLLGYGALLLVQMYALVRIVLVLRELVAWTNRQAESRARSWMANQPGGWLVPDAVIGGEKCAICGSPIPDAWIEVQCLECRRCYHRSCWARRGQLCVGEKCPNSDPGTTLVVFSGVAAIDARRSVGGLDPVPPLRRVSHELRCPYCQSIIPTNAEHVICPACCIPQHPDCWRENGGCAVYGCLWGPHGL